MRFPSREIVESVRKGYPVGCRVVLDHMEDPYRDMPRGTQGTVTGVDDTATIFCAWDNHSSLGVVYGEDSCHRVASESEIAVSLSHFGAKGRMKTCPRCGNAESQENRMLALSRRADITVCESCGTVEALEDAGLTERMELKDWAIVKNDWQL